MRPPGAPLVGNAFGEAAAIKASSSSPTSTTTPATAVDAIAACSADAITTRAEASVRTYATSFGCRCTLTGTSHTPASTAASESSNHSTRLSMIDATWSPGESAHGPRITCASRVERSTNSLQDLVCVRSSTASASGVCSARSKRFTSV